DLVVVGARLDDGERAGDRRQRRAAAAAVGPLRRLLAGTAGPRRLELGEERLRRQVGGLDLEQAPADGERLRDAAVAVVGERDRADERGRLLASLDRAEVRRELEAHRQVLRLALGLELQLLDLPLQAHGIPALIA